jgi:hypothetical protein
LTTGSQRSGPQILQQTRARRVACMITHHGQIDGVIVAPECWGMLTHCLALLEQITLGRVDVAEGRLTPHEVVKSECHHRLSRLRTAPAWNARTR